MQNASRKMQNVSRKMQNVSRKMQNISRKTQDSKYKSQNARNKTQNINRKMHVGSGIPYITCITLIVHTGNVCLHYNGYTQTIFHNYETSFIYSIQL